MGRGRQKAKATRQAREMKYYSPQTDYTALERELTGAKKSDRSADRSGGGREEFADYEDPYAEDYDERR